MIINATSHTMKNIWRFFLFICLFIAFLFVILTNGIQIENLELPKIKISQLYIKLDKKLIVTIETLDINIKSKQNSSFNEIKDLTKNLPYLYSFFNYISIQNLIFNNKTVHFLYKDKVFYIDSDFLTIDAKITDWKDSIEVDIKQLVLKDFKIKFRGNLQAKLKDKLFNFRGNFSTFNINGNIELRIDKDELYYRLNTKKFKTLKPFMDFLSKKVGLEPLISAWVYKKIVADEYILHNLDGKFNLNTYNFYPNLMKARASGKNAVIKFDKNAPSALVNNLDIILKNDQLIFDVKKAEYQGKDVTSTKVHIYNLMTKGAGIIIDINADIILDDSIHAILNAFHINVPITQTSGTTKSNVKLDIGFLPIEVKNYTGHFKIKDANILIDNLPIYSKSGYIELDNNMLHFKNVNLKYNTLFDIYTSGDLNLTNQTYKSKNKINSLHVNFDDLSLLHVEDFNTTATLQIDDNKTSIYIDSLKTNLEFFAKNNKITVDDLSLIYPYSPLMKSVHIKSGSLKLKTKDFENYNILAKLRDMNLPLERYGKQIKEMDFNITVNGKDLNVISGDKNIELSKRDGLELVIKNTDVTIDSSESNNSNDIDKLTIIGINSSIVDTNSTLKIPSNYYEFKIDKKNLSFTSNFYKQTIIMKQTEKTIYISGQNLTALFVNNIFGKNIFENGSFEVHLDGTDSKHIDGTITAKNTIIKEMAFYNNLMALIHTIPSLITFKNPGFNEDGYVIDKAFADFKINDGILGIKKLNIDGKTADIVGSGIIILKTGQMKINLQISVLKNLTSIVGSIPIVNYIFLGKDNKMYTSVNITGTLENPKIKTNILKDTALSPIGIIKRTIETPFRVFQ